MTTIIIGASLSGLVTADQLKQRDPTRQVIVIDQGEAEDLRKKYTEKNAWEFFPLPAELKKLDFFWQTEVKQIDPATKTLICWQGEQKLVVPYDQLVVATGSSYTPHQSKFSRYHNAYLYRAQEHYQLNQQKFAPFKRIAILGYDATSLQLASQLVDQGKRVSLLHYRNSVLFQFFDHEMIAPFEQLLEKQGIAYYPQATYCQAQTYRERITALDLGCEKIPVDCIVTFAPTFPNTKLLRGVVDLNDDLTVKTTEAFQTSQPDLFAVGDIVAFREADGTNKYLPSLAWELQTAKKVVQLLLAQESLTLEAAPFTVNVFDHFLASYGITQDLAPYRGMSGVQQTSYHFGKEASWCGTLKTVFEPTDQRLLGVQVISRCPAETEFDTLTQLVRQKKTLQEALATIRQLFQRLDPIHS